MYIGKGYKIYLDKILQIGNTREQLFHAWRSFNFDENTERVDAYVTYIRQVPALHAMGNHKF